MSQTHRLARASTAALLAFTTVAVLGGCSWFGGAKGDYALSPEARPLEVPPDLNLPDTSGASKLPNTASALTNSAPPAAVSGTGFQAGGSRDEVFAKLGPLLSAIEGLTVSSSAPLLGVYDVTYGGGNFLVRVAAVEGGAYVSAVDPRGLPATAEAPLKVVAALQAALAQG